MLTCVLASRVTTSIAHAMLSTRRSREAGGVVGILLLVLVAPVLLLLVTVDWGRDGLGDAQRVRRLARRGPRSARPGPLPGAAAQGDWGAALVQLLIAVATLGLLWLAWTRA